MTMDDLDLRRLRYFVVVAETLSFVRAARLLHMTQPALSRQIAALESSLGVRLFDRSSAGTRLSEPGRLLLDQATAILSLAAELQRTIRAAGRPRTQFTIGFMPGVDAAGLIREFRLEHPELDVSARFTSVTDQAEYIADGRVDIAFVRLPLRSDAFIVVELFEEALVAAVAIDDPLADRERVALSELRSPLSVLDGGPGSRSRADRSRASSVEELLVEVGTAGRHGLLPAGISAFYADPAITYLTVKDAPSVQVALAYDHRRSMPHLDTFVDLCRRELGPWAASTFDIAAGDP